MLLFTSNFPRFCSRLVLPVTEEEDEDEDNEEGDEKDEMGQEDKRQEVWLFWRNENGEPMSKSIQELTRNTEEGSKQDRQVLVYYRSLCYNYLTYLHLFLSNWLV